MTSNVPPSAPHGPLPEPTEDAWWTQATPSQVGATPPPPAAPRYVQGPDGQWRPPAYFDPAAAGTGPMRPMGPPIGVPKPSSNLVGAVLSTCFCFLPLGIVACIYAAQVDTKWNAGDVSGAVRSSKKARTFANLSLGVAALVWVGLIAIAVLGQSATTRYSSVGGVGYTSGGSGSGMTPRQQAYLQCLADPNTTYTQCERLYGS